MSLVECIPNFSEGRDQSVIAQLSGVIKAVNGVHLLDVSSDPDHNRTVITFSGEPKSVEHAAFDSIALAAKLINLDRHRGVHPRIGATDVVPFVPLRDCTMDDCVTLAHNLGKRVGDVLDMPVYLYEYATSIPERRNLADVRRGGYEHLKLMIGRNRAYDPDFGPARLTPSGGVIIGARKPLIAFNAFLDTTDVEIAKAIAREIRESSGGLKAVKALGLFVDNRAQVSMNVVDFQTTGLFTIMQRLNELASYHGTIITETELVGLMPQSALIETALSYLQLPRSSHEYILEGCIGDATGEYKELLFDNL